MGQARGCRLVHVSLFDDLLGSTGVDPSIKVCGKSARTNIKKLIGL